MNALASAASSNRFPIGPKSGLGSNDLERDIDNAPTDNQMSDDVNEQLPDSSVEDFNGEPGDPPDNELAMNFP